MSEQGLPSTLELIEHIHVNTLGHFAFVVGCNKWPCNLIGPDHAFTPWPADEQKRARYLGTPISAHECCICGKAHRQQAVAKDGRGKVRGSKPVARRAGKQKQTRRGAHD